MLKMFIRSNVNSLASTTSDDNLTMPDFRLSQHLNLSIAVPRHLSIESANWFRKFKKIKLTNQKQPNGLPYL